MNARPLPIRVEPYEDEPWSNYLDRIASRLSATPQTVRHALGIYHGRRASAVDWGLAMGMPTRDRCARRLNLEPSAVEAMQMQRFTGRVLDFPPDSVAALDPVLDPATGSRHGALARAGWMYARPASRACSECLREQPDRWYLSWRLPWHLHCSTHGLLITPADEEPERIAADSECLSAERALLTRAYAAEPSRESLDYVADVCAVADSLIATRLGRPAWHTPRASLLRLVLVEAVYVAEGTSGRTEQVLAELRRHQAGYHHVPRALRRFLRPGADGYRSRLMSATGSTQWSVFPPSVLRAPALLGSASTQTPIPPRWLPQQMSMKVFAGELSDLLYPQELRDGRHVATLGCLMLASGCTLLEAIEAQGNFWRCNARRFQDPLHRLESQGREELFWRACVDAMSALERSGIDYDMRRTMAKDPTFHDELRTECWVPYRGRMLQRWLVQEWACDRLLAHEQNTVEQRAFDRLDADYADILLAAADRVLERRRPGAAEVA